MSGDEGSSVIHWRPRRNYTCIPHTTGTTSTSTSAIYPCPPPPPPPQSTPLTSEMVPRIAGMFLQRRFVDRQGASEELLPTQQRTGGKHDRRQVWPKASGLASGLHGLFSLALFQAQDGAYVESARVSRGAAENGRAEVRRFSQLLLCEGQSSNSNNSTPISVQWK